MEENRILGLRTDTSLTSDICEARPSLGVGTFPVSAWHNCAAMTPEERARIRQLPALIANENDPEKMKILAAELQRLLSIEAMESALIRSGTKPRSR